MADQSKSDESEHVPFKINKRPKDDIDTDDIKTDNLNETFTEKETTALPASENPVVTESIFGDIGKAFNTVSPVKIHKDGIGIGIGDDKNGIGGRLKFDDGVDIGGHAGLAGAGVKGDTGVSVKNGNIEAHQQAEAKQGDNVAEAGGGVFVGKDGAGAHGGVGYGVVFDFDVKSLDDCVDQIVHHLKQNSGSLIIKGGLNIVDVNGIIKKLIHKFGSMIGFDLQAKFNRISGKFKFMKGVVGASAQQKIGLEDEDGFFMYGKDLHAALEIKIAVSLFVGYHKKHHQVKVEASLCNFSFTLIVDSKTAWNTMKSHKDIMKLLSMAI